MTSALVKLSEIGKSFGGISVLEGINLELQPGSVHALLGENGAGKSTLMKVLAGIHQASSGRVFVKGEEQQLLNAQQSQDLGIAMIHQELMYVPDLSIAENMYLGHEPKLTKLGFVDKRRLYRDTEQALLRLGLEFSPDEKMRKLNVSQRQLIEIAKAISRNADILIMDEPTSALEDREIEKLFAIMRGSSSTKEIAGTIDAMRAAAGDAVTGMQGVVAKVSVGVGHAQQANDAIKQIRGGSHDAVVRVEEIAVAIRQQGAATDNIAKQIERIAAMSEENHTAAANGAQAAESLEGLSTEMRRIVSAYRL